MCSLVMFIVMILSCLDIVVVYCFIVFDLCIYVFFFFKQKTAYEMRISDWSSDVCSSDLRARRRLRAAVQAVIPSHARAGRDYVVIARAETLRRPFADLKQDLEAALKRLGAWHEA